MKVELANNMRIGKDLVTIRAQMIQVHSRGITGDLIVEETSFQINPEKYARHLMWFLAMYTHLGECWGLNETKICERLKLDYDLVAAINAEYEFARYNSVRELLTLVVSDYGNYGFKPNPLQIEGMGQALVPGLFGNEFVARIPEIRRKKASSICEGSRIFTFVFPGESDPSLGWSESCVVYDEENQDYVELP